MDVWAGKQAGAGLAPFSQSSEGSGCSPALGEDSLHGGRHRTPEWPHLLSPKRQFKGESQARKGSTEPLMGGQPQQNLPEISPLCFHLQKTAPRLAEAG